MKITFISNYLTHHQIPFSEAMMEMPEVEYTFIATEEMEAERIQMGWSIQERAYELRAYESIEKQNKAEKLALESDVVIIGSAPDAYIIPRLKEKKLTFKYAERFYKKKLTWKNWMHAALGSWLHHGRFQKYPLYMLCASAYTAADCAKFCNYKERTFKWGYFPEVITYDLEHLMKCKEKKTNILWAGRLIEWKHPEVAVFLAERLKRRGYTFAIHIIGNGEMKQQLQELIKEKQVSDCVYLEGTMKPEEVRHYMENASIYLGTSDFNEGWGAVLNEAMNSGCTVIASHAMGAAPFLIRDGKNGMLYENGNLDDLEEKACALFKHKEKMKVIGANAYRTIHDLWNAEVAAARFVELITTMVRKAEIDEKFAEGPCSRAHILKNDWYLKADKSFLCE